GRMYLHSRTLGVFSLSRDGGVGFLDVFPDKASELGDLRGMEHVVELRPGDLTFDEAEWIVRLPAPDVKKRVREGFHLSPTTVTPVFFPMWRILIRRGGGDAYRAETVDAMNGIRLDWPEPPR